MSISRRRAELRVWFRNHLTEEILPRWLQADQGSCGVFLPGFDRRWQPLPTPEATLVSQCRLIYCFAAGWRHTRDRAYLGAVERGVNGLLEHWRDPIHHGFFWSVSPDGQVADTRKDLYGHAFVIFGLAHASAALQDDSLAQTAREIIPVLWQFFGEDCGGMVPSLDRELQHPPSHRTQNPLMHLFEAHLALLELQGTDRDVVRSACRIGKFVHFRLGSPATGHLPEMYDEGWAELPGARGGRIDLGHAMEWAFLLSRGDQLGLPGDWLGPAEALLSHGLQVGEDPRGGLHSNEAPEGGVMAGTKGCWQQCELLRTLLHFAATRDREDLWERLETHLAWVRRRFIDGEFGGWYHTPAADDGTPPEDAHKGDVWKLDYHVTGMCEEALRVL